MSPSGIFYCAKKALGVGVVAHPQGPLAHGMLLLVGSECSLAISLSGEGIEMGTHLWMGESRSVGTQLLPMLPFSPGPPPLPSSSRNTNHCEREESEE